MKHLLLAIAALATMFTSCNTQKVLILYYSQTGTTQVVAEELQKQLGADIERIDVAEAYDGDFMATVQRFNEERQSGFVPTLLPLKSNLDRYETIFIGYPVWSGTYAPAVAALLNSANLDGKTVVSFCTFGSGGLNTSTADLVKALPNSTVRKDTVSAQPVSTQFRPKSTASSLRTDTRRVPSRLCLNIQSRLLSLRKTSRSSMPPARTTSSLSEPLSPWASEAQPAARTISSPSATIPRSAVPLLRQAFMSPSLTAASLNSP